MLGLDLLGVLILMSSLAVVLGITVPLTGALVRYEASTCYLSQVVILTLHQGCEQTSIRKVFLDTKFAHRVNDLHRL
jgi:hypothetical protein